MNNLVIEKFLCAKCFSIDQHSITTSDLNSTFEDDVSKISELYVKYLLAYPVEVTVKGDMRDNSH